MPEPRVSVVISTYNRPTRLKQLLDSLRGQTVAAEEFEVVVVNNGSTRETQELLDSEAALPGLVLRTSHNEVTRGPAGGRNSGWRLARAPLVAFIDDDCVAHPEWLSSALGVSGKHHGAIVQGRTIPDPDELDRDGLRSHTVRVDSLGPYFEACNIFYPRPVLESLGGFDETFGLRPAGEDTDLAWRAIESGHEVVFAPQAVAQHAVEVVGWRGALQIAARWSPAVRVIADHQQTRSMLHRRVFWNVWHYLLWRSALALAAPRWLRRMILTRHLLELRKRARRAGSGSGAIPFLLLHDLVECWAVARGGVRYRTIVL